MYFHDVCSPNVSLVDHKSHARRKTSFYGAIVFSGEPVSVSHPVRLVVTSTARPWQGSLRVGIVHHNPGSLSKDEFPLSLLPYCLNKTGWWAGQIPHDLVRVGNVISVTLTRSGTLEYVVNFQHRGAICSSISVKDKLWLVLELYGSVEAVKIVSNDACPFEVVSRGPEAIRVFNRACHSRGTRPVFQTRVMILGQDGVGKTSLRKSLIGESPEMVTPRDMNLSASCRIDVKPTNQWMVNRSNQLMDSLLALDSLFEEDETYSDEPRARVHADHWKSLSENAFLEVSMGVSIGQNVKVSDESDVVEPLNPPEEHELLKYLPEEVAHEVRQRIGRMQGTASRPKSTNRASNLILNLWDFAGECIYYTTHQVFLTSRAIYLLVFNLGSKLAADEGEDMSSLEFLDFWLHTIHAHTARNMQNHVMSSTLSPPIFIIGTHRASLSADQQRQFELAEERFNEIRKLVEGKPYQNHVVDCFYAVENTMEDDGDAEVGKLRKHIEQVASCEAYMGEHRPVHWIRFERALEALKNRNLVFVPLDQVRDMAMDEGLDTDEELLVALQFYHDLGFLVYFGSRATCDVNLINTVILRPQWLVDVFRRVLQSSSPPEPVDEATRELWKQLDAEGVLDEQLVNAVWKDMLEQKETLLCLMEKFDLICQRLCNKVRPTPPSAPCLAQPGDLASHRRCFYVPSRVSRLKRSVKSASVPENKERDLVFFINFGGFLPDGLYNRVVTRSARWSQESSGGFPQLHASSARFSLDEEHDFLLHRNARLARVKVVISRVASFGSMDAPSSEWKPSPSPSPLACARVRNFLESILADLREMWVRRATFQVCVPCPCDALCTRHSRAHCSDEECLHFLSLDACLATKAVCCEFSRRVKTAFVRRWFPLPPAPVGPVLPHSPSRRGEWAPANEGELPEWMRCAAKLLNVGAEGQDWLALAAKLGYKPSRVEHFSLELNPSLRLIADWIITSGNTSLSVDVLVACLEQISRQDVAQMINSGREIETSPPPVFISYQWDIQDEVKMLRDRLEKAGYRCWMDIGQIGGGDQLYSMIDRGIRNAKVVLACVTPKYIASQLCNREVQLADVLRKQIIPVMFHRTPWPPPGGMALVFAHLTYVDMKGIGGHGGQGIHADVEDRYREILNQVARFSQPENPRKISLDSPGHEEQHSLHSSDSDVALYNPSYPPEAPFRELIRSRNLSRDSVSQSDGAIDNVDGSNRTVPQVAVRKCYVCVVL